VGNTPCRRRGSNSKPVHPHARGEHLAEIARVHGRGGSSPRTWGTQRGELTAECASRFIPTHVGNTRRSMRRLRSRPVHPHARGEH